ncbi:unnamed protein product [Withania somnifera]
MYADQVEEATRKSIKERINSNADYDSVRWRQTSGKRHREEDDKWVRNLYEPHELRGSNQRVGTEDLRLKLQRRRSIQQATEIIKSSLSGSTRDLRVKLSGTGYSQTVENDAPKIKLKAIPEVSQPAERSVIAEAPVSETKNVASKVSKKSWQKAESVDTFLQALGLEKYAITFQAEEVDIAALVHMTDEDLKAMGIPMGPRKKILLALESKV